MHIISYSLIFVEFFVYLSEEQSVKIIMRKVKPMRFKYNTIWNKIIVANFICLFLGQGLLFGQLNWQCAIKSAQWSGRHGFSSVVFKDKVWVIKGAFDKTGNVQLDDIWYSSDLTLWECATKNAPFPMRISMACAAYKDHIWIINGAQGC